jgi:hypothetical protein
MKLGEPLVSLGVVPIVGHFGVAEFVPSADSMARIGARDVAGQA